MSGRPADRKLWGEMFWYIFGPIMFCVIVTVVLTPYFTSKRRHPREMGQVPIFETFCSGSSGIINRSGPIRLSVYADFIVFCFVKPYLIELTEVRYCQRSFLLWQEIIEIEHRSKTAPENIQLAFEDTATFQKIMMQKGKWQSSP